MKLQKDKKYEILYAIKIDLNLYRVMLKKNQN